MGSDLASVGKALATILALILLRLGVLHPQVFLDPPPALEGLSADGADAVRQSEVFHEAVRRAAGNSISISREGPKETI